jgi:uncharacterized protein YfaS (alpha-2-macroglobulin family)
MQNYTIGDMVNIEIDLTNCDGMPVDSEQILLGLKNTKGTTTLDYPVTRISAGIYHVKVNTEPLGIGTYTIHVQARGSYQAASVSAFAILPSSAYRQV